MALSFQSMLLQRPGDDDGKFTPRHRSPLSQNHGRSFHSSDRFRVIVSADPQIHGSLLASPADESNGMGFDSAPYFHQPPARGSAGPQIHGSHTPATDSYPKPAEGVRFALGKFVLLDCSANQPPQPDGMRFNSAHHFSQPLGSAGPQIHGSHTPATDYYENPAVGVPFAVGQPFLDSAANQLPQPDGMGFNSAPYFHQPPPLGFPAYGAHQTPPLGFPAYGAHQAPPLGFPAYGAQQPAAPLPRKKRGLCSFFRNFLDFIRCCTTMENCYELNGDCCDD